MATRIQYRPVPGRITGFYSVWLVLRSSLTLVGFVRHDGVSGRWISRQRDTGNGIAIQCGFRDRTTAATWLLVSLGGFEATGRPA